VKFVKLPLGSRCVFRDEQDVIGLLEQIQLFVAYGWPARVGQSGLFTYVYPWVLVLVLVLVDWIWMYSMLRSRPTLISTMQMYLVRCTLT
jgi:hypothetical protein